MNARLLGLLLISLTGVSAHAADSAWFADAPVTQRRGVLELVALDAPVGPAATDIRLARPMAARWGDRWILPPEPVLAGALLKDAVAWVTQKGELIVDDGKTTRVLAREIIPEIAASPSGDLLAYSVGPGRNAGVYVWDGAKSIKVTGSLAQADRPLFLDDTQLVVAGAQRGALVGVWLVDLPTVKARQLTNRGLRVGAPLGPAFVPPPADHASMRVENGYLLYFDGIQTRHVVLP